jgi:hypothetical protein
MKHYYSDTHLVYTNVEENGVIGNIQTGGRCGYSPAGMRA